MPVHAPSSALASPPAYAASSISHGSPGSVAMAPQIAAAVSGCSRCGTPASCSRVSKGRILFRRCDGSIDEEKEQQRVQELLAEEVERFVGEGKQRRARDLRFSFEGATSPSLPTVPLTEYRTPLNLDQFEAELAVRFEAVPEDRHDRLRVLLLLDSIRNGVNIGYDGPRDQTLRLPHHGSASDNPEAVEDYYAKEMAKGRVTRWLDAPPFKHFKAQPIGVVPKTVDGKETGKRIINDLSAGGVEAVNAFIHKIEVQYGDYEDLVNLIVDAGKGAFLSKFDVKSAFRLLAVRLCDLSLQVVEWKERYAVDLALVFGGRSSPPIWDRVAAALRWILQHNYGISNTVHVDDYLMVHGSDLQAAMAAYNKALQVCAELGVPISLEKSQGPTTRIVHVGLVWDTAAQTVSVTDARRAELKQQLEVAINKKSMTAADILSLHGKLTFVSRVLQPARCFLYSLRHELIGKALDAKRRGKPKQYFRLSAKVREELAAWQRALQVWAGEWLLDRLDWSQGCLAVYSDACRKGQGGYSDQGSWFSEAWSADTLKEAQRENSLSLPFLEMKAAVTAIKTLAKPTLGSPLRIRLMCDCLPVVEAVNKGYCHVDGMACLLFDLGCWCVERNVYLRAEHLSSSSNRLADLLSRLRVVEFIQESGYSRETRVRPLGN